MQQWLRVRCGGHPFTLRRFQAEGAVLTVAGDPVGQVQAEIVADSAQGGSAARIRCAPRRSP
jgi:hypothetical protein